MKRTITVVAATCLTLAAAAPAGAISNGGGNSGSAPGQTQAFDNCLANFANQFQHQVIDQPHPDAGVKGGYGPVENCDHFYQQEGVIGGGS
jgi:hypothetical protein